jgi:hypothetical protein
MDTFAIEVDGRRFVTFKNSTVAHDVYLMNIARACGLSEVTASLDDAPGDLAEIFATKAYESGHMIDMLGALYVPEGFDPADWRRETAEDVAHHLNRVTDPATKAKMLQVFAEVMMRFFLSALSSSTTSRRSGQATEAESAPIAIADPSISEIGRT